MPEKSMIEFENEEPPERKTQYSFCQVIFLFLFCCCLCHDFLSHQSKLALFRDSLLPRPENGPGTAPFSGRGKRESRNRTTVEMRWDKFPCPDSLEGHAEEHVAFTVYHFTRPDHKSGSSIPYAIPSDSWIFFIPGRLTPKKP